MPDKGDTEIVIPTYKGMTIKHGDDVMILTLYSETGRITIRCTQSLEPAVKGTFDEDKD